MLIPAALAAALITSDPSGADGAAPGDLDATFGTGGSVTTPVSAAIFGHAVIAVQPDGKILVATDSETNKADLAIARYDATGGLDPTWGTGGVTVIATSPFDESAVAIALQPDGKVVVAVASDDLKVARFDPTGTLDPTWAGGGILTTPFHGGTFDAFGDILLLPGGDLIVAGSFFGDFALARYDPTGAIDLTFGGAGIVSTGFGAPAMLSRLERQADGKILATGAAGGAIVTARYFASGASDPGFGTSGVVVTSAGTAAADIGRDIVVQPDGKILVLGQDGATTALGPTLWLLIRYAADGTLDPSWGGTGIVATSLPVPPASSDARALLQQGDGQVIAVGSSLPDPAVENDVDVATVRYQADGSLDTSWGGTGMILSDFGSPGDVGTDAILQADARLLVAGTQITTASILLARYEVGAFCGDGILEGSESCDDGNALAGDCCSPSCSFEAAATSCTDDGLPCTRDTCDGAGACLHAPLPDGAACEDGNPCTNGETCTASACAGGVAGGVGCLNPFVCYKTGGSKGFPKFAGAAGVGLVDGLESGSFDVKSQFELCVPAELNESPILDPAIRQVVYKLKPTRRQPKHVKQSGIVVQDPFGTHSFDTKKADLLLTAARLDLASQPAPPAAGVADGYKCYKVRPTKGQPPLPRTIVTARDELEDRFYDVFQPRRLCFPVDRDGNGIVDPTQLITCYRLRRAALQPAHEKIVGQIRTADDLGDLRLDTKKEKDLCVPATLVP